MTELIFIYVVGSIAVLASLAWFAVGVVFLVAVTNEARRIRNGGK